MNLVHKLLRQWGEPLRGQGTGEIDLGDLDETETTSK